MIYFIFGEDSFRSKRKLEEIVLGYKEKNKSGLSLSYIDAGEMQFKEFYSNFKTNSMFAEKKLIVLKNVFGSVAKENAIIKDSKFQEDLQENIKDLENTKDIIVIYEDKIPDKRTKLFKSLQKCAKCQEFNYMQPALLKKWVVQEFDKNKVKINIEALELLVNYIKDDLWRLTNEINKLSNYKINSTIVKEDIELLVKPNIESDIFKTIDALASKNKKLALSLLHKHLDDGEFPLKLLAMISYQFRTLLIIKDLQDNKEPYAGIAKKSGLHPFVVQKNYYLCSQFSMEQLKKIYQNIFQIDSNIKIGKIEPETALDLLLSQI